MEEFVKQMNNDMIKLQADWVKAKLEKEKLVKNSNSIFEFFDRLGLFDKFKESSDPYIYRPRIK